MRADAPASQPLSRQTIQAYAARWAEWSAPVLLFMNGSRSTAIYQSFRQLHHDRITLLHQALGISMKIISRYQMDDPRLPEIELQRRIQAYRMSREKMNPWKNKPQRGQRGGVKP